ncbi:protein SFI1 homolog [Ctenodactylus gundi]
MEKKVDFRYEAVKKPYFPRALPTKKSFAFSGNQKELRRPSHPVRYPASHTWTRRGRLRELRIRCVARKFLYLWIQTTFGRVFPSKARFYYEQRMLRRVFEGWKEEWWLSCREWKLCVRADCHYRYYLYNLMFQNWRMYIHQQQVMRSKYLRAKDHDAKQKMRQAWKSWLIYVVVGRTKHQMQASALEFRQQIITRTWWNKWRQRHGQARVNHALHATAVRHRALSLQLRAWLRWQQQILLIQRERWKVAVAVQHHQRWQKQRSLRAWLAFLSIRRAKKEERGEEDDLEMAKQSYHVTLLCTYFCTWHRAWEQRQSLYACEALVEELARRMALRRAFLRWRHYMLWCAEEAAEREAAEANRRRYLLTFCFKALKDNVTSAHLQRVRRNLAHHQHDIMLLRRFWNLWQSRIEQREEKEQLPLLCAAQDLYRVKLLRRFIKLWLQHTQKRRGKQLLQARADGHFQQRALPAAFHAWSRLWRWREQESILNTRAACFHRETLEKQVFALWRQKMFQHRENRLAERIAILQAERQLLRRFWSLWHQRAVAHCLEQERQAVACAHHHHRQLRKTFSVWQKNAQGLRTERMGRAQAARLHSARLLRWAWSRWREAYQGRVQSILQEVAARESQHNRELLRWVLRRWRENTVARADEARKSSQANAHYRKIMCSKVLVQWREVASVQIHYRQQEACALREARKVLDRGCLQAWFKHWRIHSQRAAQQRAQLKSAAQHHRWQLLHEAVARWKVYHLQRVRKQLLQRQGTRLLAQRLGRACFHQWRLQLLAKRQEQQNTVRALWFWAISLQAKAWAAWLDYVLERKRKKARMEQAVQSYHQQLLQEGATRLLRFTAGVKAVRQQLHTQQQVQAAHSLHRAVCRCAELWKRKVLGPGRESGPVAPVASSRRVTFSSPLLDFIAGAGDATLETSKPQALRPQEAMGSWVLSAKQPQLMELPLSQSARGKDLAFLPSNTVCSARKQPRCPHFLLEPVQCQRPPGYGTLRGQGPEKPSQSLASLLPSMLRPEMPQAQSQSVTWPAGTSLTGPFLPGAPSGAPRPKLSAATCPSPQLLLLPSSSFTPQVTLPSPGQVQPATIGPKSQASSSLVQGPDPHLLLSGDSIGTRAESGLGSEAAGYMDLEAELEEIQQQLQHYQTTKQNLWSCQRQAKSLRKWLELSREEPSPENRDAEQQVQRELEKVEMQIQQLAEELLAQRQPISASIARIQALRLALC